MNKNCHFKRDAVIGVDLATINDILSSIKERGGVIYNHRKFDFNKILISGYIEVGKRFFKVTCRYKGKIATYVFDLTTGSKKLANSVTNRGMNAYIQLVKMSDMSKIPDLVGDDVDFDGKNHKPFSAGPIIGFNPKFNRTENFAYGYDVNSAYSAAMLEPIPDTSMLKTVNIASYNAGIVEQDEIGFSVTGELVNVGEHAMYRFKAMESPFQRFVSYYYNLKKNAKDPDERQRAKDILNMAIGYFQRKNPFIRACIIGRANKKIKDLLDENSLYWNTDSFVSLKKRTDIVLGNEIGQFKVEHKGKFRYSDNNYQWNGDKPSYRGVIKEWFPKGYNILTDELPVIGNIYEYDYIKQRIRRRKNEKIR